MSNENQESTFETLENLKQKHDLAWAALKQYIYEVYEPRFYKHKVGRKQEPINPWRDLQERTTSEEKIKNLSDAHHKAMIDYWKKTGDHLPVSRMYVHQETTDGPRWVKESPEEAALYQTSLRTPRSQRPS